MYSLTSANRYYLYQGFVRMSLGIDGLFKIIRSQMKGLSLISGDIFLFFGSHKGAERGTILYTIALTCRMHKVNLFDYLTDVINRTAGWQPNTPLEKYRELLPDRWRKVDEFSFSLISLF